MHVGEFFSALQIWQCDVAPGQDHLRQDAKWTAPISPATKEPTRDHGEPTSVPSSIWKRRCFGRTLDRHVEWFADGPSGKTCDLISPIFRRSGVQNGAWWWGRTTAIGVRGVVSGGVLWRLIAYDGPTKGKKGPSFKVATTHTRRGKERKSRPFPPRSVRFETRQQ